MTVPLASGCDYVEIRTMPDGSRVMAVATSPELLDVAFGDVPRPKGVWIGRPK